MKRKIKLVCVLITLLITTLFSSVSVYAIEDVNFNINPQPQIMSVSETLEELYETIENIGEALAGSEENLALDACQGFLAGFNTLADAGWISIKAEIKDDSWSDFDTSSGSIIDSVEVVVIPVAFAFAAVFFCTGAISKLYKHGEIDEKGLIEIVMRLAVIGVWIGMATKICGYIYDINAELVSEVFAETDNEIALASLLSEELTEDEAVSGSGVPIVGFFVDLINTIVALLPRLLATLVMIIVAWCVSIKLIIRQLECVCLISVSPLFFATLASETTSQYFRNFILSYIGVVFETLFMAITYVAGYTIYNDYLQSHADEVLTNGTETLRFIFIVIAIGIAMFSPPKALKSLVNA